MKYAAYRNESISRVGFGGICVMNETPKDAERIVGTAIDRGITYFDVAPTYGNAEERLGPALAPYRNSVFLACKTNRRDAATAKEELAESLRKLETDHFDLYQLHGIETDADVDEILGSGGALEALRDAKERGVVRYLGFSAHNEAAALRLLEAFPFDSVLFPVNRFIWHAGGTGPSIAAAARERGAHTLALKALALRRWHEGETRTWAKTWYKPVESYEEAREGLRFTLSQSGVVAAVSPGHEEFLWWACDAVDTFEALGESEEDKIAKRSRAVSPVFSTTVTAI